MTVMLTDAAHAFGRAAVIRTYLPAVAPPRGAAGVTSTCGTYRCEIYHSERSPENLNALQEPAVYSCFKKVTTVASLQEDGASRGEVAEPVRLNDVFVPIIGKAGRVVTAKS